GASGFIGGDALHAIASACPQYDITCLVPDSDVGASIASQYARVRLAYGGLDDAALIEEESQKADIVCYFTLAGNATSVEAASRGLMAQQSAASGFLICTTDSCYPSVRKSSSSPDHVHDDLDKFQDIVDSHDEVVHHVLGHSTTGIQAQYGEKLRSAIVAPSYIYGTGRGPSGQHSPQVSELCKVTLERDHGIRIGDGKAVGSFVHISDLSDLLLRLVNEAASGGSTAEWPGKPAVWGREGVYFTGGAEHEWAEVAEWIATQAHRKGFTKSPSVEDVSLEAAREFSSVADSWAVSLRVTARRGREVLKWQPHGPGLQDEIGPLVDDEARARELVVGHAQKASGDA
ncbi:hypothetical protein K431DRAFT_233335, partial [Polychaeton citri CBS 116435]